MPVPQAGPPSTRRDTAPLAIGVLGEIRAARDGDLIELGAPKARAVLAALAMAEGRPVDVGALVGLVWPDDQVPREAVSGLHVYVSGLRRVLEPQRTARSRPRVLVTSGGGYALARDEVDIDAVAVARVATDARQLLRAADGLLVPVLDAAPGVLAATVERIDDALGRWRGQPYREVVDTLEVAAARARLDGVRLSLLQDRAVARLALGQHVEAAAQLGALVVERPLDERLGALHAVALARSGQQAEALDALRAIRRRLADELGVDPGPALRELEAMVLRQDGGLLGAPDRITAGPVPAGRTPAAVTSSPVLDARPEPVPGPAPVGGPEPVTGPEPVPGPEPVVGRDRELAALAGQLDGGGTRIVQLVGEAGIGKSTLAAATAARARARGHVVCESRCPDDTGAPPLWPWTQLLRSLVDEGVLHDDELALPVRDLLAGTGGGAASAEDAEVARFRLFEAVTAALVAAASRRPCVLVLDDLHWADSATARLLAHLAAAEAGRPAARTLVLVVTRRPDPVLADRPGLAATLDALARHGTLRLDLDRLGAGDVADLARRRTTWEVDDDAARTLHERSSGNPFMLVELLRLGPAALRAGAVPAGVRDVLQRRLATMPEPTRALLATASVCGDDLDLDLLAAAAGSSGPAGTGDRLDAVLDALDPAIAAGLVTDAEGGRPAFAHALTRDAVYAAMGTARRAHEHARVAEALQARRAGRSAREVAHHLLAAGPRYASRAWRAARDAAREAERMLAVDEAASLFDAALAAQEQDGGATEEERDDLAYEACAALLRAGRWAQFLERVEQAATVAEAHGDVERLARFAIMPAEGGSWTPRPYGASDAAMIRRLRRVLELLPSADSGLRCRVMLALGSELYFRAGSSRERRALAEEGVAMARRLGDDALLGRVCQRATLVLWRGGNATERLALAGEAVECAERAGAAELLQTSLELRMSAAMEAGRIDLMLEDVEQLTALSQERPTVYHAVVLACLYVPWLAAQGRFAEAQARFAEAAQLGEGTQLPWAGLALGTARVSLATWRGDFAAPDPALTALLEHTRAVLPGTTLLVSLRTGDLAGTRAFLDGAAGTLDVDDFTRLFHHALAAEAAWVTGDASLAAAAYAALAPDAGHVACAGTGLPLGPVDAFLALAAAATGDRERAAAHAEDALRLGRTWGLAAFESWLLRYRESGGW